MLYLFQLLIQLQAISKNPLCISRPYKINLYIIVVQLFSHVQLWDPILWTAGKPGFPVLHCLPELAQTHAHHWLMPIESVMPFNHLILCHPLLLLPSFFPSIRFFSSKSVLYIRYPKYWSFSFSISPCSEYSGLISFRMDWLDLLAVQGILKSLLQHHSSKASILWCSAVFIVELSVCTWPLEKP